MANGGSHDCVWLDLGRAAILSEFSELLQNLREILQVVLVNQCVQLAYLFGSMVNGTATPMSDVDIGLLLEPGALAEFGINGCLLLEIELMLALENEAGVLNPDVRVMNDLPLWAHCGMVKNGCVLYCSDEARRIEYEVGILRACLFRNVFAKHVRQCCRAG